MNSVSILGCGWLGMPLAKQLAKYYTVRGSVRKEEYLTSLQAVNVIPNVIDLTDEACSIPKDFLDVDTLIITIPPTHESHVNSIKELLVKVRESSIKHLVYCSAISVYGNQSGLINEDVDVSPMTERAKRMVAVERMLLNETNYAVSILRLGGLIGAERHPAKYVSNKILSQQNACVNLVHLQDVIGAISMILHKSFSGIFNIVAPHHPTKAVYYTKTCEQQGLKPPILSKEEIGETKIIDSRKIQAHYSFSFDNLYEWK